MTGPTFSPDGKWMWNGNEWIPAPPQSDILPQASLNQTRISTVANDVGVPVNQLSNTAPYFDQNRDGVLQNSELQQAAYSISQSPSIPVPTQSPQTTVLQQPTLQHVVMKQDNQTFIVPWLGVGLIFTSLFLPFISILGIIEVTGIEMITEISEIMSVPDDSSGSSGGGGSEEFGDFDSEGIFILLAILLFGLSPFVYAVSAVISTIFLLGSKSPNFIGVMHITYAAIFFISAVIASADSIISVFDLIGIGFYMGSFAGILLAIRN